MSTYRASNIHGRLNKNSIDNSHYPDFTVESEMPTETAREKPEEVIGDLLNIIMENDLKTGEQNQSQKLTKEEKYENGNKLLQKRKKLKRAEKITKHDVQETYKENVKSSGK